MSIYTGPVGLISTRSSWKRGYRPLLPCRRHSSVLCDVTMRPFRQTVRERERERERENGWARTMIRKI